MADDDLSTRIADVAGDPAEAEVDGQRVRQQSLADLIEGDRYLRSKAATRKSHRGLMATKFQPPGAC